jgi:hypothetical protein
MLILVGNSNYLIKKKLNEYFSSNFYI